MSDQADQAFEILLDSAAIDTSWQLQLMVDIIVAVQEIMPMLLDGWEQFKRDIEYTNEKHGYNLTV